jgi:hypothetical protein
VNFVLHHHLAARDLGRPEAAVGAMLLDVWRMADRRARARRGRAAPEGLEVIMRGVEHHFAADAWFHGAAVFERGERATREALRAARGVPKIGLFAHIAWELCLDGAFLRRAGTEAVLHALRASIASVRPQLHHGAAEACVDVPIEDKPRFERRVDQILDAIAEGPWVSGYATAPGIVDRLEGLRARLGFAARSGSERAAVVGAFEPLEPEADLAVQEILR